MMKILGEDGHIDILIDRDGDTPNIAPQIVGNDVVYGVANIVVVDDDNPAEKEGVENDPEEEGDEIDAVEEGDEIDAVEEDDDKDAGEGGDDAEVGVNSEEDIDAKDVPDLVKELEEDVLYFEQGDDSERQRSEDESDSDGGESEEGETEDVSQSQNKKQRAADYNRRHKSAHGSCSLLRRSGIVSRR